METRKLHMQIYTDIISCRCDTLIRKYFNPLMPVDNKRSYILNQIGYPLCKKHNLTVTSCDSSFMKKMGLPCRHLLKLRSYLSLPLYDSSLANKRWTKSYYILSSDARFSESNIPAEYESPTITGTEETNS